jgi:hypothetical protein
LRYALEEKKVTKIAQIDQITGKILNYYDDYQEAADAVGVCERTMRRNTHPKSKPYAGYLWRKVEVDIDDV